MRSVGEILRKEREARGVSLQEISDETKISMRFLRAIEEEHFDRLPGGIFNKSFIRQYARYLGLDEDSAVQDYMQIASADQEPPEGEKNALSPEMQPSPAGTGYFRLVVAAIGLGALVAGLAYGLYRLKERASPSTSAGSGVSSTLATASPPSNLPSPLAGAEQAYPDASTDTSRQQPSTPAASNALSAAPKNPMRAAPSGLAAEKEKLREPAVILPESELELRIDSLSLVWLSFTTDSGERWQGFLQPKQTKQVKASGSIHLTVGDAGAVALSLNGNSLPPLGRPGEVKKVTITSKGLEPSP